MKRKILLVGIVFFIGVVVFSSCAKKKETTTKQSNDNAKQVFMNFTLSDLNGQSVDLYDSFKDKGKVVIIDLFATWCGPCRMEIPGFVELQNKYKDKLVVIGISFDKAGVDTVKKFAQEMKMNYHILMGNQKVAQYVQLRGIPRTFVLKSDFTLVKDMLGYHSKKEFDSLILRLVK